MDIFILSSGRPLKQTTFENLPISLQERATIVVPYEEIEAYNAFPNIGIHVKGIGHSRQWCVENGGRKIVMLDDDLVFATRRKDNPTKFRPATEKEIEQLFYEIEYQLNDYAHVGVGTREGGNRNTSDRYYVNRMLRVLAYDTRLLRSENIRFDRMGVMEDFDVTLSLLNIGRPNVIINWIVHNQNGSNLAGGCSQYRTKELQADAAHKLARLHHPHVKVVQKQTKTAWGGEERTDVFIQWKRAYRGHAR